MKSQKKAFAKKAELFLNPPVGFVGYKGFEKFIRELPDWKNELSIDDYDKLLFNMVQFFGTVPTVPNALKGVVEKDEMEYCGGFDKVYTVLTELSKEYQGENMGKAAEIFVEGAPIITEIKDIIVAYLLKQSDRTEELPELFTKVLECMKYGFELLT